MTYNCTLGVPARRQRQHPAAHVTVSADFSVIDVQLECILDSGAGREICSHKELIRGVPRQVLKDYTQPSPEVIHFGTGGGDKDCRSSIGAGSVFAEWVKGDLLFGRIPYCVTVLQRKMSFLWKFPALPYHVTLARHLRIRCPEKFR